MELLQKDDPAVVALCQQYQADPAAALCGLRVSWDGAMEPDGKKQKGSTVLVPLAATEKPNEGKLLRAMAPTEKTAIAGRYVLGDDEVLTLIAESDTLYSEERIWFAGPNLRLRTSVLKQADGFSTASFCSEIRRIAPAAQASPASSAAAQ